jgi:hypothetical protein
MPPTPLSREEQQAQLAQLQRQQPWLYGGEIELLTSFATQLRSRALSEK